MKIIDVKLDTVCGYTSTLPVFSEPEIAFAGRSNVGKSSLINVLMKRKRLARVGETPGKTRTINFYKILAEVPDEEALQAAKEAEAAKAAEAAIAGEGAGSLTEEVPIKKLRWKNDPTKRKGAEKKSSGKRSAPKTAEQKLQVPVIRKPFFLVDLPGYGYANVSEDEKARWGQMIENYLNTSQRLHRVFLLVDIRHEPNSNDILMHDWIVESGYIPVIIATKADKISRSQAARQTEVIRRTLGAPEDTVIIPFSALSGQGASEIYRVIEKSL